MLDKFNDIKEIFDDKGYIIKSQNIIYNYPEPIIKNKKYINYSININDINWN